MDKIDTVVQDILACIEQEKLPIPSSIDDYDFIACEILHKHHRATLSNNDIKTSDVLKRINPEYAIDKGVHGFATYKEHGEKLNLTIEKEDVSVSDAKVTRKHLLIVRCDFCSFSEIITAASLIRRKMGVRNVLEVPLGKIESTSF